MNFPRGMNNKEKEGLKEVKASGLAFELKYHHAPHAGAYMVNVPALCGTYFLEQPQHFCKDLKRNFNQ